ncbi:MAG: peptidylprolyl isomerase [Bryobacterales bacterium]|nr:peptidylprolyl isomerase [Acidobacteriota bacterium]MCB9383796.1 peptidylprolyl isomerase [Bryobacterales bacterium]
MRVLCAFALAALIPAASFADVAVVEEIIVKVNGDVILRSEFDRIQNELRSEVARDTRMSDEQKLAAVADREKNALRDLIDERLLVQKGKEVGVNVEPQVLAQRERLMEQYDLKTVEEFEDWATEKAGMPAEDLMERMRENFLSQSVLGQEVGSRIFIPREEIQKYYDEHKDEFVRSEGVRLAEILISKDGMTDEQIAEAEKEAREVHDRVQRGEPFAEMARRYSDSEGSKEAGGDIGIWRRGSLQKELEDMVFDKNPGFITDLIPTSRGWLILKVVERYREGLAELDEVEDEIRNKLIGPRYAPAIREYLTELREKAYIEIRPGYIDSAAAPGQDTSWTDPANLTAVTTTREEVLKNKKKKLLWLIPMGGGKNKDKGSDGDSQSDVGSTSDND